MHPLVEFLVQTTQTRPAETLPLPVSFVRDAVDRVLVGAQIISVIGTVIAAWYAVVQGRKAQNSAEKADRAVSAIEEVARHTAETAKHAGHSLVSIQGLLELAHAEAAQKIETVVRKMTDFRAMVGTATETMLFCRRLKGGEYVAIPRSGHVPYVHRLLAEYDPAERRLTLDVSVRPKQRAALRRLAYEYGIQVHESLPAVAAASPGL